MSVPDNIKRGVERYKKEIDTIIQKKKSFSGRDDTQARVYRELADLRLSKIRKQFDRYKDRMKSEAISPEDRKAITNFSKELKPLLQKEWGFPVRVTALKSASPNPWIQVRVGDYDNDIIPNDYRKKVAQTLGWLDSVRDPDDIVYGNISGKNISLNYWAWLKVLGRPLPSGVKAESLMEKSEPWPSTAIKSKEELGKLSQFSHFSDKDWFALGKMFKELGATAVVFAPEVLVTFMKAVVAGGFPMTKESAKKASFRTKKYDSDTLLDILARASVVDKVGKTYELSSDFLSAAGKFAKQESKMNNLEKLEQLLEVDNSALSDLEAELKEVTDKITDWGQMGAVYLGMSSSRYKEQMKMMRDRKKDIQQQIKDLNGIKSKPKVVEPESELVSPEIPPDHDKMYRDIKAGGLSKLLNKPVEFGMVQPTGWQKVKINKQPKMLINRGGGFKISGVGDYDTDIIIKYMKQFGYNRY